MSDVVVSAPAFLGQFSIADWLCAYHLFSALAFFFGLGVGIGLGLFISCLVRFFSKRRSSRKCKDSPTSAN